MEAMAKRLLRGGSMQMFVATSTEAKTPGLSRALRIAVAIVSAGLAGLPQASSAQTMSAPGQFAVGPMGAATYAIPIALPPGTAGVMPALSLQYTSQAGNGLLGVAWAPGGLPLIGRCRTTMAHAVALSSVNYHAPARSSLDGQRFL